MFRSVLQFVLLFVVDVSLGGMFTMFRFYFKIFIYYTAIYIYAYNLDVLS